MPVEHVSGDKLAKAFVPFRCLAKLANNDRFNIMAFNDAPNPLSMRFSKQCHH
ncbi:MAG: hypothetical protein IPN94_14980 [Sphingobacteriales bacterium]|nr:hypothetical protein [Sphingobacteriales bacterium]